MAGDTDVFVAVGDPDRLMPMLQAFLAARYGVQTCSGVVEPIKQDSESQSGQRGARTATGNTLQGENLQVEGVGGDKADGIEALGNRGVNESAKQSNAAWFDLTDDGSVAVESEEVVAGGLDEVSCRTKVADSLRFHTPKSGNKQVSLKEYVKRMKESQHDIYYITGADIAAVSSSPPVQALRKKSWEVLYIVDPVELYCVQQLKEFDGKPLKSLKFATKEGSDIGTHLNPTNHGKVAEVLRFHTSKSGDEQVSLKEYVDRMKESQNDIFCVMGNSISDVSSSPLVQTLRQHGLEVLYLVDPVEEYCVQQLKEFEGKKFVPATREGAELLRYHTSESGAGLGDSMGNAECSEQQLAEIAEVLCLHSSESGGDQIRLEEYVSFMPEGQDAIYCITGESVKSLSRTPSVKACRKRGFEVLYLLDPVDEYCVRQLKEFDGLPFEILEPVAQRRG